MAKGPPPPPKFTNRKANFNFEVLEKFEAGIVLSGSEVKSLRAGHASLEEAWAHIRDDEAFLRDLTIQPYSHAGTFQHKSNQERKLLLHKREIRKLITRVTQKGLTLIPLEMYFNESGRVKVRIALCRGKKLHDKRETMKKKDAARDIARQMRRR